jgi:glycogen phosphorylase
MQEIINQLKELSYNLYWSYNNDFISLFEEINSDYWKWSNQNPVQFLNAIDRDYLFDIIEKKNLREKLHIIYRDFKKYLTQETYFEREYYETKSPEICYLSAEYGIAKCLKFYSGGLGTLSGDHLKSSSDLGIPLVAIGLAYHYGYFRQYISQDLRQAELYEYSDFEKLPMTLVLDDDYRAVKISIDFPGRKVYAQIWKVNVGRVKLYLLDTFVDENTVEDKRITDILYGGESEKRILQEILIGIGGMKALDALNINVKAFHINEGHSAFLCFERIKNCMKKYNIAYKDAKAICYYSNIFTTHTPVPAGIDIFSRGLMDKYFRQYAETELKISFEDFFNEGDITRWLSPNDHFNMAYLAINNSNFVNGVSKLHGKISREMWSLPETRTQITSITNGVHMKSYLSKSSEKLFRKKFGKEWTKIENIWERISELPDGEIWEMRQNNRKRLVKYSREKMIDRVKLSQDSDDKISDIEENLLDENTLTIGFARRFATYKRGTLLFRNLERLRKIILNDKLKVQFIFSGKSHPKDEGGKYLISEILKYSENEDFKNKIVFLENYDISVAKILVQGCDVWLNTPTRPLEASGTSGMKIVANGGLNFSILDGWWCEGYTPENGWVIDGKVSETASQEEINVAESESMYDILENQIIPLFYKRDKMGIPVEWVKMIKNSIKNLAPYFNTDRMVKEYTEMFYMKVK